MLKASGVLSGLCLLGWFAFGLPSVQAAVYPYGEPSLEEEAHHEPLGDSKKVRHLKSTLHVSLDLVRLGQSEVPHVHEEHDLVAFVTSGEARVHVEDRIYEMRQGDAVEIPRGIVHWAETIGEEPIEVLALFSPPLEGKDYKEVDLKKAMIQKVKRSEEEWKRILTPEQYEVCRRKGTERPFSGEYVHWKEKGIFTCAACGLELFSSDAKFESSTGWPSFWEPVSHEHIMTAEDRSLFMRRTEVLCARCDSHLGHVFDDGPPPTNLRYCINSVCLTFKKT